MILWRAPTTATGVSSDLGHASARTWDKHAQWNTTDTHMEFVAQIHVVKRYGRGRVAVGEEEINAAIVVLFGVIAMIQALQDDANAA